MKWTITIAIIFIHLTAVAQFSDDFNDKLSRDWKGDYEHFIINEKKQLQLFAEGSGNSSLFHIVSFPDSIQWQIEISLSFSPSNNNRLRIVLASSELNINSGTSYVLDIGESGNQDAIKFAKITNGITEDLATGIPGKVSKAFNLTYLITKNEYNHWQLFSQNIDGSNKELEFVVDLNNQNDKITDMQYFGMICTYTSSNVDAFSFDNIKIDKIQNDTIPPRILSIKAVEESIITLQFDEALDSSTAIDKNNYTIAPPITISNVIYDDRINAVYLHTLETLNGCSPYKIITNGIQDLSANISIEFSTNFEVFEDLEHGDILINELLSDPKSGGSDYLELINPTSKAFSLKGLIIRNNDKDEEIKINDDIPIRPSQIIVFTEDSISVIENYHPPDDIVLIEISLPDFNNASGNITIMIEDSLSNRITIDSFDYNENQHNLNLNSTDGISLERIALSHATQLPNNWSSSINKYFGTPGYQNSIQDNTDYLGVHITNSLEIELLFVDQMYLPSILTYGNYDINGIEIVDISVNDENNKNIFITLENELSAGTIYKLKLSKLINSCMDTLSDQVNDLRLIENPEKGDILINELLFNPYIDQYDFLELINNSNKFVTIQQLNIINDHNSKDESIYYNNYLKPGEIIAFTQDVEKLRDIYNVPDTANIAKNHLPAFNNDSGNVTLRWLANGDWVIIDSFDYSESMHYKLLNDSEGISLERINSDIRTNDVNNWFSSSQDNNFATPGFKNSAFTVIPAIKEEVLTFPYQIFSPDGDGYRDFLVINYNLYKPGFLANITIYDDSGYKISRLTNNHLMGNSGIFKWSGLDDHNLALPIGMYIIFYSFFHPDGDIFEGKKVVVLAQDLNN